MVARGIEIITGECKPSERSTLLTRLARLVRDELGEPDAAQGESCRPEDETPVGLVRKHLAVWARHIDGVVRRRDSREADDLMRFAPHYLAMMAIDGGDASQRDERMARFVKLQTEKKFAGPRFELNFHGPNCGSFPIRVESLGDLDFADAHGASEYSGFCVTRLCAEDAGWSDEKVRQLVGHVVADFGADGADVDLHCRVNDEWLEVTCETT